MCKRQGKSILQKAQNRAQPLAMQEPLPGVQGQDVAEGKNPSLHLAEMFAAARTFPACSFHLLARGEQQGLTGKLQGGCESLSRKLTSSFSIFRVDKRDCSCWHLCTSSLWTGCWAQSWDTCQRSSTRSGEDTDLLSEARYC